MKGILLRDRTKITGAALDSVAAPIQGSSPNLPAISSARAFSASASSSPRASMVISAPGVAPGNIRDRMLLPFAHRDERAPHDSARCPQRSGVGRAPPPARGPNNDPGVLRWRVCPDVGEIQVQCDWDSAFGSRPDRYRRILRSCQALIGNRIGFEASIAKDLGALGRQVLIDFELQTVCSKGRSAVPSRASSAG